MEQKGLVITLSSSEKGEADKLVRLFSNELGVVSATVKGARKQGSKLGCCAFTFALSEVVLNEKNGFYTVIAADLIESFKELSLDIEKFEFASAIAESIDHFSRGDLEPSRLFVLLLKTYNLLAFSKVSNKLVFIKFMLEALKISGWELDFGLAQEMVRGTGEVYLDLSTGQFLEKHVDFSMKIDKKMLSFLYVIHQKDIASFDSEIKDDYNKSLENNCFLCVRSLVEGLMGKKFKSFLIN